MAMISLSKQHCLTCSPVVLLGESAVGDPTGGQVLATQVYIGGFTCEGRSPGVGWQLMASVITIETRQLGGRYKSSINQILCRAKVFSRQLGKSG